MTSVLAAILKVALMAAFVSDYAVATAAQQSAGLNLANLAANVVTLAIAIAALLTTPRRAAVRRAEGNAEGYKDAMELAERKLADAGLHAQTLAEQAAANTARYDELQKRCVALEAYTAPEAMKDLIERQRVRDERLYEVLDLIQARLGEAERNVREDIARRSSGS